MCARLAHFVAGTVLAQAKLQRALDIQVGIAHVLETISYDRIRSAFTVVFAKRVVGLRDAIERSFEVRARAVALDGAPEVEGGAREILGGLLSGHAIEWIASHLVIEACRTLLESIGRVHEPA